MGITARESIRRKEENIKAEQWTNKNKEEMEQSKEAFEKIELQWSKVEKLTGPYEMNQVPFINVAVTRPEKGLLRVVGD